MKFERKMLQLYAVTDRRWLSGRTLEEAVEEALAAGVTMVQLREKNMEPDRLLEEAPRYLHPRRCGRRACRSGRHVGPEGPGASWPR